MYYSLDLVINFSGNRGSGKSLSVIWHFLSSTSAVTGEVENLSLSSGILPHVLLRGMVLAESAMPPELAI